jgi:hypothetical protein
MITEDATAGSESPIEFTACIEIAYRTHFSSHRNIMIFLWLFDGRLVRDTFGKRWVYIFFCPCISGFALRIYAVSGVPHCSSGDIKDILTPDVVSATFILRGSLGRVVMLEGILIRIGLEYGHTDFLFTAATFISYDSPACSGYRLAHVLEDTHPDR